MFDKLCDNLNLLMSEMRISADELGRRTNIPASTIKKIRNRYNPNPTLTTLLPLAKFFSITLGQLAGDEPFPEARIKGLYPPDIHTARQVPLLSWKESISWLLNPTPQSHTTISTESHYGTNTFALRVEEDYWENLACGTTLIVDPKLSPIHRDFVIVYKEGQDQPSLKQVLFDEDQLYLKPMINGYNISMLTAEHKILGIVVEYKKNLRENIIAKDSNNSR